MLTTQLHERGIRMWLDGDKLKVQADPPLTDDLRQFIRDNKQALIAELTPPPLSAEDAADLAEAREERSAICEYDGGLTRQEADAVAAKISAWSVLVAMPDGDERQPRWITMICTGDQDQARRNAEGTFTTQRVIDIRGAQYDHRQPNPSPSG